MPANLTATAWTLVDLDSGDVLAARDPHGRYQPASILKTLTSVTLLPLLPGKRVVTVGRDAANAEGSAVGIVAGGRYTVDQLFTGLLLMSGNDTAAALAEAAGGVRHTVALMNQTALRLGAYDTFVQTPSGLDGWQQLTSAYDMAIFLRSAVNMPRFVAYDRQDSSQLPAQNVKGHRYGSVWLGNQNENFLTTVPGALVAKNGFTDAASHTYLCAAERHGRRLGVIFLRAQRYPLDQWQQAAALLDWGYALAPGRRGRPSRRAAGHAEHRASVDRPDCDVRCPATVGETAPLGVAVIVADRDRGCRCRRRGDMGRRPATPGAQQLTATAAQPRPDVQVRYRLRRDLSHATPAPPAATPALNTAVAMPTGERIHGVGGSADGRPRRQAAARAAGSHLRREGRRRGPRGAIEQVAGHEIDPDQHADDAAEDADRRRLGHPRDVVGAR